MLLSLHYSIVSAPIKGEGGEEEHRLSSGLADVVTETGYHDHAEILVSQGVEPSFKRKYEVSTYAPGLGVDREGLYVNYDKAHLGGYGFIRLFLRVPRRQLRVSPELAQNGITDVDYAFNSHDGAVTVGVLSPSVFYKVEIRGVTMTPEEYLKSRGFENVPKLPTVPEYEAWLRQNAEKFFLQERHIDSTLSSYERANLQGKMDHVESMD